MLFGAVLGLLLKGRFPRAVTAGVYSGAFAFDAAIHLALGFLRADNSLLLSLMPLTAYLPLAALSFLLSKRSLTENFFTVFIGVIAALIVELAEKMYVPPILSALGGTGADLLCIGLSLLCCTALALAAYFFLCRLFWGRTSSAARIGIVTSRSFFSSGSPSISKTRLCPRSRCF